MKNRKKWFIDRIEKKVFRTKTKCTCDHCNYVYKNGLKIFDTDHADYLFETESISNAEGYKIRYFDTKEQVKKYEKELQKNKITELMQKDEQDNLYNK